MEPPPEFYGGGYNAPQDRPMRKAPAVNNAQTNAVATELTLADEGEFWHRRAVAVDGLIIQGKIVGYLRKSSAPSHARVLRLLARGVMVRERDEHIGFVTPDDVFLQMGEPTVTSVLSEALTALGITKRVKIERTDDDLYQQDLVKAKQLFTRDGVIEIE